MNTPRIVYLVRHVEPMKSQKGNEVHVEFEELEQNAAQRKSATLAHIENAKKALWPSARALRGNFEHALRQHPVGPRQTRSITDPKLIAELHVGSLMPKLPPQRTAPHVHEVTSKTGRPITRTPDELLARDLQRLFSD